MQIIFNGSQTEINETDTAADLKERLGFSNSSVAVWVNGRQVLYKEYTTLTFNENDNIKMVRLIGGG